MTTVTAMVWPTEIGIGVEKLGLVGEAVAFVNAPKVLPLRMEITVSTAELELLTTVPARTRPFVLDPILPTDGVADMTQFELPTQASGLALYWTCNCQRVAGQPTLKQVRR